MLTIEPPPRSIDLGDLHGGPMLGKHGGDGGSDTVAPTRDHRHLAEEQRRPLVDRWDVGGSLGHGGLVAHDDGISGIHEGGPEG